MACDNCGHPKISHRYGGANEHGTYNYHSSCRKSECPCQQYK